MGPAPVSPVVSESAHSHASGVGHAGTTAIGRLARSVGKPGHVEHLGSVVGRTGKGLTNIGGGAALAHMLNNYAKNPPPGLGEGGTAVHPTRHPGSIEVRGQAGEMDRHPKFGGLGPGRYSRPGPAKESYIMSDTE